jgi:hypothetical protein
MPSSLERKFEYLWEELYPEIDLYTEYNINTKKLNISESSTKLIIHQFVVRNTLYEILTLIQFSLKRESTNSVLLKSCKSVIPSPSPMYFTGILN